jgi:hypothetical protein
MSDAALKVVMTLLVRNEDDIIEDTILFHHRMGVDAFIVMDNLSTDRTPEILSLLASEIPIDVIHQPEDNYAQGEWVTSMARTAYRDHGADWVINGDADEFWLLGNGQTLKPFLAALPSSTAALTARRFNAVLPQRPNPFTGLSSHPCFSTTFEQRSTNTLGQPLPAKCLHRGSAVVTVHQGNHAIEGLPGSTELCGELRILHYPYRSFSRYQSKIALGGQAYSRNTRLPESVGRTWREHHRLLQAEGLQHFWAGLHIPDNQCELALLQGDSFEERTVVEALGSARRWWQACQLQRACAALAAATRSAVEGFTGRILERAQQTPPEHRARDPFYQNLHFTVRGARRQQQEIEGFAATLRPETLPQSLGRLRDVYSLFPANRAFFDFLASLLELLQPEAVQGLRQDLAKECVILHISCCERLGQARRAAGTVASAGERCGSIVVVGADRPRGQEEIPLGFSYAEGVLSLPVADSYEALATKVFYATLLIHLVGSPDWVVKLDDDIGVADPDAFHGYLSALAGCGASYGGRPVSLSQHWQQLHGWHIGKCQDPLLHGRGYQYPLPATYAAGGHGYVLGRDGIEACAYMFMAMKAFFGMDCVELEDVFVGHAMAASGIDLVSCAMEHNSLALPGLARLDERERSAL